MRALYSLALFGYQAARYSLETSCEVMGPGMFYWQAIFFKFFGVTFLATRICLFLTSLGTGFLTYFLARRVSTRYATVPCVLLAAVYFGIWPGISHHVASNCFALLSVALLVIWVEWRKNSLLFFAGFISGVTTTFLQPKGIFLLFAIILWLWVQRRRLPTYLSALGLVIAGYCASIGITLAYFLSRGALWDLAYVSFVWPFQSYGAVNVVSYAHGLIDGYWDVWVTARRTIDWSSALATLLIVPFLFVAALPALFIMLGARYKWFTASPTIVLYCFCGWALWLSEFHRKDIFHLVVGSPLLIILCIFFLAENQKKIFAVALQVLTISATCLACFNLFLVSAAHPVHTRVGSVAMFGDNWALKFLIDHTTPGEEIFAYPYCPMYYFLSATTNPTRYSILLYNYNTNSQFEEVVNVLDRRRVRYVIWDTKFSKNATKFFPSSKPMRSDELIIEPYLESHYNVVKDEGDVRIMERKAEAHNAD